jgi:hypothetical protein
MRGIAWVMVKWASTVRPRVMFLIAPYWKGGEPVRMTKLAFVVILAISAVFTLSQCNKYEKIMEDPAGLNSR